MAYLTDTAPVPVKYSYWVIPNCLLAGEYPGALDLEERQNRLYEFFTAGVDCFIDLTTAQDGLEPYQADMEKLWNALPLFEKAGSLSPQRLAFPVPDCDVPESSAAMARILDAMDEALSARRCVYVHCWGGRGRTGTVISCWLKRHCKDGLLAQNKGGNRDFQSLWRNNPKSRSSSLESPENPVQRDFVASWPYERPLGFQPFPSSAINPLPGAPLIDTQRIDEGRITEHAALVIDNQAALLDRARGLLYGQLAGDSLGSLVEFMDAAAIAKAYPDGGPRELKDGGCFDTIAGQPTDDSELALALARSLVAYGGWHGESVRSAYVRWLDSGPFDCGMTIRSALRGSPTTQSQANGALMRISPLGIAGAFWPDSRVAAAARADAALTHPNPVCVALNVLYARALALAVREGPEPKALYALMRRWAQAWNLPAELGAWMDEAAEAPPADYMAQMGWVKIAFKNALWQLLHARSVEEGIVDTVRRGGDTDTNAAIVGALLGAVYGAASLPEQWRLSIDGCRPEAGKPGVRRPRPKDYWPADCSELSKNLLMLGWPLELA